MDDQQRPAPADPPSRVEPPADEAGQIDPPSSVPEAPLEASPPPQATEPVATPSAPIATPSSGWVGTSGPADGSAPLPPPPSDTTRKRVVRGALVVAVIILFGLGSVIVRGALSNFFASEHEKAANEAGQRILSMPAFKERYGDVTSADRAFDIGQELVTTALPRLSAAELVQYWQVTAKILDVADPEVCGKILRQLATPEEAQAAAESLDIASWRTLISVTVLAIERELNGVDAAPSPTEAELNDAYIALAQQMGEAQVTAAGNTMTDTSATNAAVCDAGKAFLGGVMALPETPRATILRFMVEP